MTEAPPRFVADEMLGKLARELRVLGYDVAYATGIEDHDLLEQARREDRLLLTRDQQLAAAAGGRAVLVRSLDPPEQLAHVIGDLELRPDPDEFLSRCIECNGTLEEAPAASVPESVEGKRTWRCTRCSKTYWWGTHAEDMYERLGHLLEARPDWAEPERKR